MESMKQFKNNNVDLISNNDPLDKNRALIEDLWESVLMESMKQFKNNNVDLISNNDPLDKNRALIEDLWESVLREECPDDQANRLIQLKELSYSNQVEEYSSKTFKNEMVDIVNSMDLAESISAARAFSLYFQLVNILEQRVEEDRYIQSFTNQNVQKSQDNLDPS